MHWLIHMHIRSRWIFLPTLLLKLSMSGSILAFWEPEFTIELNGWGHLKSQQTPKKVLVFNRNSIHLGLVVDSVDSIATVAANDKVKMPQLPYREGEGSMSDDISEAFEVTDTTGKRRYMLIISADSAVARSSRSSAA